MTDNTMSIKKEKYLIMGLEGNIFRPLYTVKVTAVIKEYKVEKVIDTGVGVKGYGHERGTSEKV
jgi:hypothetical protein